MKNIYLCDSAIWCDWIQFKGAVGVGLHFGLGTAQVCLGTVLICRENPAY